MFGALYGTTYPSAATHIWTGMYCIGGNGAAAPFGDPDLLETNIVLTVERYNEISDTWTVCGPTPAGGFVNHFGWGFGPDGALVAGGQGNFDVGGVELETSMRSTVWLFVAPDTWMVDPTRLAYPSINVATAVVDDVGYGFGGAKPEVATLRQIFAIRPNVATWEAMSGTLPTGRAGAIAGTIEGKVYIAGGSFDQSNHDREIYEWDTVSEVPRTVIAMMKRRDVHQAGGAVGDSLFVFGGKLSGSGGFSTLNQQYTPARDVTTSAAHTNKPARRDSASFVDADGGIYLIGGRHDGRDELADTEFPANSNVRCMNRVERYDPSTDTWSVAMGQPADPEQRITSPLVGAFEPNRWSMSIAVDPRRQEALGLNT